MDLIVSALLKLTMITALVWVIAFILTMVLGGLSAYLAAEDSFIGAVISAIFCILPAVVLSASKCIFTIALPITVIAWILNLII